MKSVELFLTLGLATTLGLSGTVRVDANEHTSAIEAKDSTENIIIAQGGEGGEGVGESQ